MPGLPGPLRRILWVLRRLSRREEGREKPAGVRSQNKSQSLQDSSDSSVERKAARQRNSSISSRCSGEEKSESADSERRRENSNSRTETDSATARPELQGRLHCGPVSSRADRRDASLGSAGPETILDCGDVDNIQLVGHNLALPPPPGSYCVARYK